jgi:hypothetical protein
LAQILRQGARIVKNELFTLMEGIAPGGGKSCNVMAPGWVIKQEVALLFYLR